jgi:hypothetical protein
MSPNSIALPCPPHVSWNAPPIPHVGVQTVPPTGYRALCPAIHTNHLIMNVTANSTMTSLRLATVRWCFLLGGGGSEACGVPWQLVLCEFRDSTVALVQPPNSHTHALALMYHLSPFFPRARAPQQHSPPHPLHCSRRSLPTPSIA